MSLLHSILLLPDYAIPGYIAIIELGPMGGTDLARVTRSSPATAFRSIAAMRNAGLLRREKGGTYALINPIDTTNANRPVNVAPVLIGSTLATSDLA